jgi:hypothetical protein
MSDLWVYVLGEKSGADVKIGHTRDETLRSRLRGVNGAQTTMEEYVLLAGVRGSLKDESRLKRHFDAYRRQDKGARQEYFRPDPEVVQYVHWLRAQWWAVVDDSMPLNEAPAVAPEQWMPDGPSRRLASPEPDVEVMVQEWQILEGPLAGTAWDWMPDPKPSIQDYYTPPELIDAARTAMGDIDIDAASHWCANRVHRIPDYFTIGRSAFEHDWNGRVWLNPPYGNNGAWFDRISHQIDSGNLQQLVMLSPVHAFNTRKARDTIMRHIAGMVLLSPAPVFWGNSDGRTGTNLPHAIVYIGPRCREFFAAYSEFGIPFTIPEGDG